MADFQQTRSSLILGIQVSQSRLSLVVLDLMRVLVPIYADHVIFDMDLPKFRTDRGVLSFPSMRPDDSTPVVLTPAIMLVEAVDLLLDRAFKSRCFSFDTIEAIGIAGDPEVAVLLSGTADSCLKDLNSALPLWKQLRLGFFSSAMLPVYVGPPEFGHLPLDHLTPPSSHAPAESIAGLLVPLVRLQRSGSLSQYLSEDCWARTRHVTSAAGLVATLLTGNITHLTPEEAERIGMPADVSAVDSMLKESTGGHDSHDDLWRRIREEGTPSRSVTDSGSQPVGRTVVSQWLSKRYSVSSTCHVSRSVLTSQASFISFLPDDDDIGLALTEKYDDLLSQGSMSSRFFGHAEQRLEMCRRVAGGRWEAASRVSRAIPPGGSIGLDDNFFCIVTPRDKRGVARFESGMAVSEFADRRLEARCLLEGQALAIRSAIAQQDISLERGRRRLFCWGRAAGNAALVATLSEVLGIEVLAHQDDLDAGRLDDTCRSSDSTTIRGHSSSRLSNDRRCFSNALSSRVERLDDRIRRAMLGAAYSALVDLLKRRHDDSGISFKQAVLSAIENPLDFLRQTHDPVFDDCGSSGTSSNDDSYRSSSMSSTAMSMIVDKHSSCKSFSHNAALDGSRRPNAQISKQEGGLPLSWDVFPTFCPVWQVPLAQAGSSKATACGEAPKTSQVDSAAPCLSGTCVEYANKVAINTTEEVLRHGQIRIMGANREMSSFYEALLPEYTRLYDLVRR
ncbi:hypothetical protein BCV70DRAFT_78803 [Testicularia cyperi]|uniref:Uncharacterized protein n=1 Tax=Testicularia cyperi TaxID=1882483 RepID=A0A317XWJ5_9BASI|nr:hypothetical protein BCV70DRAFT_78803 [Testicularia cyperi]